MTGKKQKRHQPCCCLFPSCVVVGGSKLDSQLIKIKSSRRLDSTERKEPNEGVSPCRKRTTAGVLKKNGIVKRWRLLGEKRWGEESRTINVEGDRRKLDHLTCFDLSLLDEEEQPNQFHISAPLIILVVYILTR